MGCLAPCRHLTELFSNLRKSPEYRTFTESNMDINDASGDVSCPHQAELSLVARASGDGSGVVIGEHLVQHRNMAFVKSVRYQVVLYPDHLAFTPCTVKPGKSVLVRLVDITGCECVRGSGQADNACYLTLYNYPRKKDLPPSPNPLKLVSRKRCTLTMVFDGAQSLADNEKSASLWRNTLMCVIKGQKVTPGTDLSALVPPPPPRLLVLVNPCSGPGKALTIFQEKVVPMFAEAGIHFTLQVTERAGHGYDMMRDLTLGDWSGVIIVSGDGLIYEVVNGLMARPDWQRAIKLPLGTVPGGSGNALSCALSFYAGESWLENQIVNATYLLTKHTVLPFDVIALDTCTGKRVYSFLSVTWGYMSDVDIESEKYRAMGNARFTLGALVRLAGLRKYRARVSFLPVNEYTPRVLKSDKNKFRRSQSEYSAAQENSAVQGVAMRRATSEITEEVGHLNGELEEHSNSNGNTIEQKPTFGLGENSDNHINGRASQVNGKAGSGDPSITTGATNTTTFPQCNSDAKKTADSPPCDAATTYSLTPLLPPLSQPVPSDWVTIEEEFVSLGAIYLTHLGPDLIFSTNRALDEGEIDLCLIYGTISRGKLLSAFMDLAEGKVSTSRDLEFVRVKAFRLEPLTERGMIAVDGERVDYGPIQGQVMKGLGNIMVKEK